MSVRRIPLIPTLAGLGVALFLLLLLPSDKVPLSLVRLFAGEPVERIDIVGGSVIEVRVDSGDPRVVRDVASAVRARAARAGLEAHTIIDGDRIHLGLLRVEPEVALANVEPLLVSSTALSLQLVDEDSAFMSSVARDADVFDTEQWVHDESGRVFRDIFLAAPSRAELEQLIARAVPAPEPGRELAIETRQDGTARSYYLHSEPVIDGSNVADAQVVVNEYTNYPEVLLTLDEDGARRFGDATAANVGRKIAIVVDGRVESAPIIQTAIPGGRLSITLGAGRPYEEIQREAGQLAATLGATPLPAPVEIGAVAANPAHVSGAPLMLARLLLALFVGAIFFGVSAGVQRAVKSSSPLAEAHTVGGAARTRALPWPRLLVTVAAPALVIIASSRWLLPGIDPIELDNLLGAGDAGDARAQLGVLALGLMPILSGFVLVELIALAVPRLRPLRDSGGGRLRLGIAAIALGAALALFQGWMIAVWIESLGGPYGGVIAENAIAFRPVTALTLAGGSLCLVVVAWLVSRYGLGNGFSVLLATGLIGQLWALLRNVRAASPPPIQLLAIVGALGAVALATVWVLRARAGGKRLPAGGLVPIGWSSSVIQLITILAWLGVLVPLGWLSVLTPTSIGGFATYAALLVALGALCSYLFSRAAPFGAANLTSTGYLLLLAAVYFLLLRFAPIAYIDLITVAAGTAILLDLYDEWRARARHGELTHVLDLHRLQQVDPTLATLRDAGIPAHARGAGHRALLHFFGPFVPISILVPRDRAGDAARALTADDRQPD